MRKEKTNQKIIRRAITWAMAVLITFSSVGGNIMTVYAGVEGEEQNTQSSESQAQAPMSERAETATTAVNTATEAKDNAKSEADDASEAVEDAEEAVNAAKKVVESATGLSKEAVLENVSDTTSIDAYNANVAADQQKIDDISKVEVPSSQDENSEEATSVAEISENGAESNITGQDNENAEVENDSPATSTMDLVDYAQSQAKAAENAAAAAKGAANDAEKGLKEILSINPKEVENGNAADKIETIKKNIEDAADKAEEAYNEAKEAKENAESQKDSAIEKYNLYAMSYGLPKYGEPGVTYTEQEAKEAIEAYNNNTQNDSDRITYRGDQKDTIVAGINIVSSISQNIVEAEAKVVTANDALEKAEEAVDAAKEAKDNAQNAIYKIKKDEQEKKTELDGILGDAKKEIKEAEGDITVAQKKYEKVAEDLAHLKKTVESRVVNSIDLETLNQKIKDAEAAVKAAEDRLKEAEVAKVTAENYVNWAEELFKEGGHVTRVYCQAKTEEDGSLSPLTENINGYDLKNELVKSRPQTDFISITENKQSIIVPYVFYRDYVEAMYNKCILKDFDYKNGVGEGSSVGTNLDVLYWVVDANGNVTGDFFETEDELTTGRYFVGYVFKREKDGYHIDGLMFDYTKQEKEENPDGENPGGGNPGGGNPDGENSGGGNPGDGNPGGGNPGGGNPGGRAASPAGDVLGAKREDIAMVAEEGDVLGATRAPKTSDSAKAILWMLVMGSSAIGAAAAMASKRKEA